MLYLILAESELETIPREISRHPVIAREAQSRKKPAELMLLDSSKHFAAMRGLKESERRGRPDIVQFCLLLALDSVLNKKGLLKVFVHTRNDKVISIDPEARLPRAFNRFCGLFEGLLEKGKIETPEGKVLLEAKEETLKALLSQMPKNANVFALDVGGQKMPRAELQKTFSQAGDVVLVVGGFPHGNFTDKSHALEGISRISVADEELCAWTVFSILLSSFEAGALG
ncbi:MAG: 16S rRNA methyltransferase [Candidatus Micrarchaeia archaeon]|jgi:rRNA small subunit pseudouridine methyltransferase Nep1